MHLKEEKCQENVIFIEKITWWHGCRESLTFLFMRLYLYVVVGMATLKYLPCPMSPCLCNKEVNE